jgi:hypothetical protein
MNSNDAEHDDWNQNQGQVAVREQRKDQHANGNNNYIR